MNALFNPGELHRVGNDVASRRLVRQGDAYFACGKVEMSQGNPIVRFFIHVYYDFLIFFLSGVPYNVVLSAS